MKKLLIPLVMITISLSLEAQTKDISFDSDEIALAQERQARLIEILKDVPVDAKVSDEHMIEIIKQKQDEISKLYKDDYETYQNLSQQDYYHTFIGGGLISGVFALLLYQLNKYRAIGKTRQDFFGEHTPECTVSFQDVTKLLLQEDKNLGGINNASVLTVLTSAIYYFWTLYLSNRLTKTNVNMQDLKDEYAFLEDEIEILKNENCSPKSKT